MTTPVVPVVTQALNSADPLRALTQSSADLTPALKQFSSPAQTTKNGSMTTVDTPSAAGNHTTTLRTIYNPIIISKPVTLEIGHLTVTTEMLLSQSTRESSSSAETQSRRCAAGNPTYQTLPGDQI